MVIRIKTVLVFMTIVAFSILTAIKSDAAPLTSKFFTNYSAAAAVMSGTPYNMDDPAWLVNGKQNRDIFAYKVFAALFMLGYTTETFQNGNEQTNVFKAFQSRNGLTADGIVNSTNLVLLDQQLAAREPVLASQVAGSPFFSLIYPHIQPPAKNDVSTDTIAALQILTQSELPISLQMSADEMVQCIAGQCNGFIRDATNTMDLPTLVDLNSDYRFVLSYFDPLVLNSKMPGAAVSVDTNLHEYAHYLDGYYYGLGGMYSGTFATSRQPHFGGLDTRDFYDITYNLATREKGCFTPRSSNPKDWISKYGYSNYGNTYCPQGKMWPFEEWAEAFQMYVTSGRTFRAAAAQSSLITQKYDWLKANVFGGREYDTDLEQAANSGCNDATGTGWYMHCLNTTGPWDFTLPHGAVDGLCGSSSGSSFITRPLTGLCQAGRFSGLPGNEDHWSWSCQGLNGGSASTTCSATILTGDPPEAPTGVNASGGNTLATVTFTPGREGTRPTTSYIVTSSPGGITTTGTGSPIQVTGLANGTAYTFTVVARNDFGDSAASAQSNSVTPAWMLVAENFDGATAIPPSLPAGWLDIETAYGNSQCKWQTAAQTTAPAGGGAHSGTSMVYFNAAEITASCSRRLVSPQFSLSGISGAKLRFWMYRDASLGGGTSSQLQVMINTSTGTSGATTLASIYRNKGFQPSVSGKPADWYQYQYDIPAGFNGSANYLILNGYWTGTVSDGGNVLLDDIEVAIPPGAPAITGVTAGTSQATVSFSPPLNNGGSAVTGYTVTSYPGGYTATGTSSPIAVNGLTNGTQYTFTVTAANFAGSSVSSAASSSVTPADVPGKPVINSVNPGNGTVSVYFAAPASDGGATIGSYTVTANPGGISVSWPSSPILVPGLTNGTVYSFTVTATNRVGSGVSSDPSAPATPLLAYDFPTIGGTPPTNVIMGELGGYSFTPDATKATSFTVSAGLPTWLNFDATTGKLSGNPTSRGTIKDIVITAHNDVGSADLAKFDITVKLPKPTITVPLTPPGGTVSEMYPGISLTTSNTKTLLVTAGNLPQGLAIIITSTDPETGFLSPYGAEIAGTPTARGTYGGIVITASNDDWSVLTYPMSITIKLPPPTIGGYPATIGMKGVVYETFTPMGCQDMQFQLPCNIEGYNIKGVLPTGLVFDSVTGSLSGTPIDAGVYSNIVISATNEDWSGAQAAAMPALTITVSPRIDAFTSLPPLPVARQDHTATLLPNGKVLIVGGRDVDYNSLAEALLFNPTDGTWSTAGSMATARIWHTATLLYNGRVLVVGGYGSPGDLNSAELYDPDTNSWLSDKNSIMPNVHSGHTATLLEDGRLLVAGGFDNDNGVPVIALDVYDPADNSWVTLAQMNEDRYGHTASLLPGGTVLFAGGGWINSAAIFDPDPTTPTWLPTGEMAVNRMYHTAVTLTDGSVLVTGGQSISSGGNLASAEIYHPETNSWSGAGSMAAVRTSHNATLLSDGTVLITGGYPNYAPVQRYAELFDPAASSWSVAGLMAIPRTGIPATLLPDGNILIVGGNEGSQPSATVELFHYGALSIATSAGSGGGITQSQTVARGTDSAAVVITPDKDHFIASVIIDGTAVAFDPEGFSRILTNVTVNHTVTATFVSGIPLTVTITSINAGWGNVTSNGGFSCSTADCASTYHVPGSLALLLAVPDSNSFFTGWDRQECGAAPVCSVTMDVPAGAIAIFDRLTLVKNENVIPPYYGLVANAYKAAAGGDTIKTQAIMYGENLKFSRSINVMLDGGYADDNFSGSPGGYSTIQGSVQVSGGKVVVRRIKIK